MQLSHSEITALWKEEKKAGRKGLIIGLLLLLLAFLVSMCFRTVVPGFIPKEAAMNSIEALKLMFADITGSSYALNRLDIQKSMPYFLETIARFKISVVTVFSGMALALSGAVFQTVYRNPLASPNMIGATVGVNLGNIIMVSAFSTACLTMTGLRYAVCFLVTVAIMGFIIIFSRITGMKGYGYSVTEMVMVGSVISHIFSTFVTFRMYRMSSIKMLVYQMLNLGLYMSDSTLGILIFIILCGVGMIPLLRMRFRMNSLGIDQHEAAAGGVNPWREQVIAQVLSIITITAALVQCGDVGLFALAVPHIVRYYAGSDFRRLAVYSCITGGVLLLVCRSISSMLFLSTSGMPINFVTAVLMLPIFIIVMIQQRRGFE